ncbi:ABC transporter substrate-binding protein [Mesorhizobium sp. 2RAF21]|uniref:ABC transporter substrate-binding protein n=1 Tax=Mesorhizobium sp. 2RAF21 TaxID=3232995 RepID=UPI003F9AC9E9
MGTDRRATDFELGGALNRRTLLAGASIATAMFAAGIQPGRAATPKKGGDLRIAATGGGAGDTVDAHKSVNGVDYLRTTPLYDALVVQNVEGQIENVLAESMEPTKDAMSWTVKLRKDITFHNGKALKASDVLFSFRRTSDPQHPLYKANVFQTIDLKNARVIDDLTFELPMLTPMSVLPEMVANVNIVPEDYDPAKPVGTGPFKLQSFTPGEQSVSVRNENYWKSGRPYLDSITVIDTFKDSTAAFNALQGGQVHVFPDVPLVLLNQVAEGGPIKVLMSEPSKWTPFTMRVDQPPFDDPRVRQAFRLILDRKQLARVAFNGHAAVGNDLFSNWSPYYDNTKHRDQDLDQAKFLLKQAGKSDLAVELMTSDVSAGVLQSAQVFARQAKDAGVTVKVTQVTPDVYYGENYLKWTFAQDYWYSNPFFSQVMSGSLPDSIFNETHWADPKYIQLYQEALKTVDFDKRRELALAMQAIDFDIGGYIIGTYNQTADLMASNVNGFMPSKTGQPLGTFNFTDVWLD